ncbi:MAG: DEAD-box ATP-dependent RNA helicase DeaD [Ktedonobacterales bacterium]|jgi:ATP-dependent RNA helicase DeaD|nr:MAG: DEAD-box ATP-dependent RNA helicase DeaD [Ktedonobacterales bacterium]
MNSTTQTDAPTTPPTEGGREAFAALGMSEASLRAIADLGYGEPTPIQGQTIPLLLAGRDLVAQAPTGTGKTAAFGLPIIERLDETQLYPQALVVVPTRELAIQVAEAMHSLGKYRELVTLPIYGGAPYERQLRALKRGVQVVVGTPGRLLDHLGRGTLDMSQVRTVVLDEADEMLNMGFIEDIEAILAALPTERQTALFSATVPPRIARLAERFLREPEHISIAAREAVAPRVRQVYYEMPQLAKPEALARILDLEEPEAAIIFVRTRMAADELSEQLNGMGYLAQAIHGEINQAQRERVLNRFRAGNTQLLVATDVAARGLDIPDVSHVINYDLPLDAESYVHRIGRTGRAGQAGEALTLVTPRERRLLAQIEYAIHRRLERLRLPTPTDIAVRRRAAFREDVLHILESGQLDPFLTLVTDLSDSHEPAELAAAAFKMAALARDASHPGRTDIWTTPLTETAPPTADASQLPSREYEDRRPGGRGRRERHAPDREMARLVLRVGRRDGVRPADLVGAVANEAKVSSDIIGDIDIYDTFSFVEVPQEQAEMIRDALNATTVRGRAPRTSLARPSARGPEVEQDERFPSQDERPRKDRWRQRKGEPAEGGKRRAIATQREARRFPSHGPRNRPERAGRPERPGRAKRDPRGK